MGYVARLTMTVDGIGSKFAENVMVQSGDFICDPRPTSLRLKLYFRETGSVSAFVNFLDRKVTIHGIKFEVSDRNDGYYAARVDTKCVNSQGEYGSDNGYGYATLLEKSCIPNVETAFWNVTCYVMYEVALADALTDAKISDSDLNGDLTRLFDTGQHADLTILVQGEKIMAHKGILTVRSQYFERMFQSHMKESDSNTIEVNDVKPTVFNELLKFLYSGRQPQYSGAETMLLLAAADKYGVDELKKICESLLHLNPENVVDGLLSAIAPMP